MASHIPVSASGEAAMTYVYSTGGICSRSAVNAICDAWQVTIADERLGCHDLLWTLLAEFARGPGCLTP